MYPQYATSSSPSRKVVVVRNTANPQYPMDNSEMYQSGNRPVYVSRYPTGANRSSMILTPTRSPVTYYDNSQVYPSNTIRTYNQPAPITVPSDDDVGCFSCCSDLWAPDSEYPTSSHVIRNGSSGPYSQYMNSSEVNYVSTRDKTMSGCSRRVVDYLSRYMCLIIAACIIILLIAIADIVVCAVFLSINPSTYANLKIAGIAIGSILIGIIIIFLTFLLCCVGNRDGFFSYFGKRQHIGGQVYALMPPPNNQQYTHTVASNYPVGGNPSNIIYPNQTYGQNQGNVVIELPDNVAGRNMTPKTRERNINKVVQNLGQVVEDAKRRNNGEMPNNLVVKVA
ncbi:unnamed protein product [Adineta steineri]|uniref:Uncharacterized protein n=1 Tax=Adineta steineri TaxID=433720 RepID=A0A818JKM8_9BILA|nr:unnamed protein product [Adineta steineri]